MKKETPLAPVLLLAFNRPEATQIVFEQIRKARPKRLFLHVDGPRNSEEKKSVDVVKKIISKIDWPCKVEKLFRAENKGITSILDAYRWFFEKVSEGIILEDDAVPSQDFFRFCSEVLKKYRDNEKIMHISGCNFQRGWQNNSYSYYFSKYPYTYGFATWRRSWKDCDYSMKNYPSMKKQNFLSRISPYFLERFYLKRELDHAYINKGAIDTKWWFYILSRKGLTIVPNKNLVNNIGFSSNSTNTKKIDSFFSVKREKMDFPIKHPPLIKLDQISDQRYATWILKNKLKKHFLLKTRLRKFFS